MRALAVIVIALLGSASAEPAADALAAAKQAHGDAQKRAATCATGDQPCTAQVVPLFEAAAQAYTDYLAHFPASPGAVEARFFRAEIRYFKLAQLEAAGDDYLAVGKAAGPLQRDALAKAIAAYDAARGAQASPIDDKLRDAADTYVATFAGGPDTVAILLRIGKLDFDRGKLDDAIRRFTLITTRYPAAPEAGAAGDLWLRALVAKSDYAAVEAATMTLAAQPAYTAPEQQARLAAIRLAAIGKLAAAAAEAHDFAKAAELYERVATTATEPRSAADAAMNAGAMFERARKPAGATRSYRMIADRFPQDAAAPRALFAIGRLDEALLELEHAAADYERLAATYPTDVLGPDALYNAGRLRRALGQRDQAIALMERYVAQFAARHDAPRVALEIAKLREDSGDRAAAEKAYLAVAARYRSDRVATEALLGAGRVALALDEDAQAAAQLAEAAAFAGRAGTDPAVMAEIDVLRARLVLRAADRISLAVAPAQLARALASKSKLWADADRQLLGVLDYKDIRWSIAALYETAASHERIADAIEKLPPPPQLTPAEQAAYKAVLDGFARQLRHQVSELYLAAYGKAIALGYVGAETLACRAALIRLGALPADPMTRGGVRSPEVVLAPVTEIQPR